MILKKISKPLGFFVMALAVAHFFTVIISNQDSAYISQDMWLVLNLLELVALILIVLTFKGRELFLSSISFILLITTSVMFYINYTVEIIPLLVWLPNDILMLIVLIIAAKKLLK